MMDYRQVFEQFKKQYIKAEGVFDFGLFPLLFLELKNYGADKNIATADFAKDFIEIFLKGAKMPVLHGAVEYIGHYSVLMLPAAPIVKKETPVVITEAPVKNKPAEPVVQEQPVKKNKGVGIDYHSPIPREEDEGDPLYTPPEERIDLKPEDCADPVTDWDFLKRINAVGSKT
jgi:hypothetical protein